MQLFLSLSLVGISFDTKTVQAVDFGVKSKRIRTENCTRSPI